MKTVSSDYDLDNVESAVDLVEDTNDIISDIDLSNTGLSETDLRNFIAFAFGNSPEAPHDVQKATTNISNKVSMGLGLTVINSLRRQISLAKKLEQMEESLLDMNKFDLYPDKTKLEIYKQVNKNLTDMAETMRKFVIQNHQINSSSNGSIQEQLMSRIMALPNDKAEEAIKVLSEVLNKDSVTNAVESITAEDSDENNV